MKRIYIGSFVKVNGELKAIVKVENKNTVNTAAERKIYKDTNGNYIIINKEKLYFDIPELKTNFKKDGIEYLSEK